MPIENSYGAPLTLVTAGRSISSMPSKQPKFRNRGEAAHWSRVKAAFVSTFNWPAKRKVSMQMVNRLAADAADESLLEYRQRVRQ